MYPKHRYADIERRREHDLYVAIQCYWNYADIEEFEEVNPELAQGEDWESTKDLWYEFDKLGPEALAEVAIELLEGL